jgi:uncharacterized membrane protein
MVRTAATRSLAYGVLGWAVDRAFTTLTRSRRRGHLATPNADLALIPIYGFALPLLGPVHAAVRSAPMPARAAIYGVAFIAAEYTIARVLSSALGRAPWDYTGTRWSVHGRTRLDYIPLWAIAGLALERIHDQLTRRPATR